MTGFLGGFSLAAAVAAVYLGSDLESSGAVLERKIDSLQAATDRVSV